MVLKTVTKTGMMLCNWNNSLFLLPLSLRRKDIVILYMVRNIFMLSLSLQLNMTCVVKLAFVLVVISLNPTPLTENIPVLFHSVACASPSMLVNSMVRFLCLVTFLLPISYFLENNSSITGPKMGPIAGHLLTIIRTFYGLLLSGAYWHHGFSDAMNLLCF
jgi:hypothetical protein